MRYLFACIVSCFFYSAYAQTPGQQNAPFTIRGNLGLPIPVTSKSFHTTFAGLFEANMSFNLRLFGKFYAGVGYQASLFKCNKFLQQQLYTSPTKNTTVPYNTTMLGNGIFLKLGYDKFFSEKGKGYFSYALNAGYMLCNYADVNPDTSATNRPYQSQRFSAPFVQPEVSVNWIVERTLSFSLMFSYTTVLYRFDPRAPRFNQFDEIGKASNRYAISWCTIGFGFNVLIHSKNPKRG